MPIDQVLDVGESNRSIEPDSSRLSPLRWRQQRPYVNSLAPWSSENFPVRVPQTPVVPTMMQLRSKSSVFFQREADRVAGESEFQPFVTTSTSRPERSEPLAPPSSFEIMIWSQWSSSGERRPDLMQVHPGSGGQQFAAETLRSSGGLRTLQANILSSVVHHGQVTVEADALAWAHRADVSSEVSAIGKLCLSLVPEARRVGVSVDVDLEDGTAGLCFLVKTTAQIDAVVRAEEELHEALFDRIPSRLRHLFSIDYEFIPRLGGQ